MKCSFCNERVEDLDYNFEYLQENGEVFRLFYRFAEKEYRCLPLPALRYSQADFEALMMKVKVNSTVIQLLAMNRGSTTEKGAAESEIVNFCMVCLQSEKQRLFVKLVRDFSSKAVISDVHMTSSYVNAITERYRTRTKSEDTKDDDSSPDKGDKTGRRKSDEGAASAIRRAKLLLQDIPKE